MTALQGCIDPFMPEIKESQTCIVIDGLLTDQEGYHQVRISRSTPFGEPGYMAETGCQVEISDGQGNSISLSESETGLYEQFIPASFLEIGNTYSIHVITTEGNEYVSTPDTLIPCPDIDDVYWEVEIHEVPNPHLPLHGIQFYTDLDIPANHARHYRWELKETWEYVVPYDILFYYDGEIRRNEIPVDSLKTCWKSVNVREIFTQSADVVEGDRVKRIPLNYVSHLSKRLTRKYSLLIKQYSLSNKTYHYWNTLRQQNQESGGFYETQPVRIIGNVFNPNNPGERVLGNFDVSCIREKRIFVREIFDFPFQNHDCSLIPVDEDNRLSDYNFQDYPIYLVSDDEWGEMGFSTAVSQDYCFDCRTHGGTIDEPDFWYGK